MNTIHTTTKHLINLGMLLAVCGQCFAQDQTPNHGYVPNEKTALKIAEAVLEPILNKSQFSKAHPLEAELRRGVWIVFTKPTDAHVKGGGTPELHIDQKTAAILSLHFAK